MYIVQDIYMFIGTNIPENITFYVYTGTGILYSRAEYTVYYTITKSRHFVIMKALEKAV